MVDQVKDIISMINNTGRKPVYVWNTSAYDHVKTLRSLEGIIDVYLPDFKYADPELGKTLSDVEDYPRRAILALKEMYRQKGSSIILNHEDTIEFGMIIRHLILPGYVENSKACLRIISEELSPSVHISLMSQYHPIPEVMDHPQLGRTISPDEYREVVDEFDRLGFYRGWVQELESESFYNPDFNEVHPFEYNISSRGISSQQIVKN